MNRLQQPHLGTGTERQGTEGEETVGITRFSNICVCLCSQHALNVVLMCASLYQHMNLSTPMSLHRYILIQLSSYHVTLASLHYLWKLLNFLVRRERDKQTLYCLQWHTVSKCRDFYNLGTTTVICSYTLKVFMTL